jgi:uncharacterized protein
MRTKSRAANTAVFGFGQTRHARRWPVVNTFAIGSAYVRLPMRQLAQQAPQRLGGLFGINRLSLIGFRDCDHGERSHAHGSALAWVDGILKNNSIHDATGEVWLQTFPRVLGYAFKPVSIWFCHTTNGELRAVLAEVHNTFGEQHCYLLHHADGRALVDGETITAQKIFHVSPFFPVRGEYHFRWLANDARSVLRIDYVDALHQPNAPSDITLSTSISGEHFAITMPSVIRALLAYPAQAFSVLARIHWQALKLWLKGVTFYSKPQAPSKPVSLSDPLIHKPSSSI